MPIVSGQSHSHDLLDAHAHPGYAFRTLAARTCWRYLDSLADENVDDPGVRAKLRASPGLCTRHAWCFVETMRTVVGAAIIHPDVLHTVMHRTAHPPTANAREALETTGPCVACVAERG